MLSLNRMSTAARQACDRESRSGGEHAMAWFTLTSGIVICYDAGRLTLETAAAQSRSAGGIIDDTRKVALQATRRAGLTRVGQRRRTGAPGPSARSVLLIVF